MTTERRTVEHRAARGLTYRAARVKTSSRIGVVSGYAAIFDKWSEDLGGFRERIRRGAFASAMRTSDVRCLVNHDANLLLGRTKSGTLRLKEDQAGLHFTVDLPDTQIARDVATSIERGDIDGCSFAFTVKTDQWTDNDGQDEREIIEIGQLFDVGPVVYPAYPDTTVGLSGDNDRSGLNASNHRRLRLAMALAKQRKPRPQQHVVDLPDISGRGAIWGDYRGDSSRRGAFECFTRGCFSESLRENRVDVLIDHRGEPIASTADGTLTLAEDDYGLAVKIRPPQDDRGQKIVAAIRAGRGRGFSLGFKVQDESRQYAPGRSLPILFISKAKLNEISILIDEDPAHQATRGTMKLHNLPA